MHTYQAGPSPEAPPASEVFPLAAMTLAIWASRVRILIVAAIAAAVAYGWALVQPAQYDASVVLKVSDFKMRENGRTMEPIGYTILLANRALAKQLIDEFQLDKKYDVTPGGMLGSLKLTEDRNASLVIVRMRLEDPVLAAKIANRFAELAIELNRTLNQKDTTSARDLIKAQLDEAGTRLEAARAGMLAFRRSAQLELSKADITAVLEQRQELADWQVTLAAEKARLAQLERDLAKQPATLSGARLTSGDAELVAAINDAARETERSRPSATARPDTVRGPEAPQWIGGPADASTELRDRVDADRREAAQARAQAERRAEVRRQQDEARRQDEVPALPGGETRANPIRLLLEYQVAAARSRVAALEQRQRELGGVARLDGSRAKDLDALYRSEEELRRRDLEVRVAEKAYAELSQRYEEARLQVAGRSAELQVVDPALVPRRPSSMRDPIVGLIGALIGGVLAMGVVAVRALVRSWQAA